MTVKHLNALSLPIPDELSLAEASPGTLRWADRVGVVTGPGARLAEPIFLVF